MPNDDPHHAGIADAARTPPAPEGTIFQQPWWLEAVSDNRYAVAEAGDANASIRLPYMAWRWNGFRLLGAPPLTHTLGPLFRLPPGKPSSQSALRQKLVDAALAELPPCHGFEQLFDPGCPHAAEFAHAGHSIGVRYTYRIDDTRDADFLWRGLKDKARNTIRRARKNLDVDEGSLSVMQFLAIYNANLESRGRRNHHDAGLYRRLDAAFARRDQHRILVARDRDTGAVSAAVLLIWDAATLYYFRATQSAAHQASGASSLLLWEALRLASRLGVGFDSDAAWGRPGSAFVMAFGAQPAQRLVVSRRSMALKAVEAVSRRIPVLGSPWPE